MVNVNMSGYGQGLAGALGDPIEGLYTTNYTAPLQARAGLRNFYDFGLYSYCAYTNGSHGTCSKSYTANRFQPYADITADMGANYSSLTDALITNVTFVDSSYLGSFTNGAWYLLLIGTICAASALLTGIMKHTLAFLLSFVFAIVGSVALLIGATIWTVMIQKTMTINGKLVGPADAPVPLGITVAAGDALYLLWAAFATLLVSIGPYTANSFTYRG